MRVRGTLLEAEYVHEPVQTIWQPRASLDTHERISNVVGALDSIGSIKTSSKPQANDWIGHPPSGLAQMLSPSQSVGFRNTGAVQAYP